MGADRDDARQRRRQWQAWFLSVALFAALLGYWKVEAGQHRATQDAVGGDARAGTPLHRLAVKLEEKVRADLPEEYRAIRPAGIDGATPPIPPSETWPAQ
jgi:hypothetical protein